MTNSDNQQIFMTNLICETLPDSYMTDDYISSINLPSHGHFVVLQLVLSNGFRHVINELEDDDLRKWKLDFHKNLIHPFSGPNVESVAILNLEPFTRTMILEIDSLDTYTLLLDQCFNNLCKVLSTKYKQSVIGCFSSPVEKLNDIGISYKEATKLQDYSYIIGMSKCLFYENFLVNNDYSLIEYKYIDHYNKLFTNKDWIELYSLLSKIKARSIKSFINNSKAMYLYKELFGITIRKLFETDHSSKNQLIQKLNTEINQFNYIFNDISEAHEALVSTLNHITDYTSSPLHPTIKKIIKLIESSYMEPLNLTYLCDLYNLSPAYLSRLFKDEVGSNFKTYLTNFRVKKTKFFLVETSLSINSISEKVGYKSASQLVRVFKASEGMTPSVYRNIKTGD